MHTELIAKLLTTLQDGLLTHGIHSNSEDSPLEV